MAEKKKEVVETADNLFGKKNYVLIGIGIVVIIIGLLLMIGGKSPDPNVFLKDEIYGFRRTTLAPIVILLGFVIEMVAIFRKP
jgi:hypothetical protein